ncbi:transcriptional regulator [Halarchaeum grantii]|uniref:Transcriptional regulator n=1 Tax=Halarchaeum grantii TaxID=1193105 RepID=A0A830FBV8_9EURY|nr:IclR family transcriptional regulator [Halarchaeum grantii]GGL38609.1 transcriptional regulator [Halarchaeum grantii]
MPTQDAPIGSVQTTIDIVEALRDLDGAGVSELATHLDLPTSTVFDHLRTLEQNEFVTSDDDGYRVGSRFLEIGGYARKQDPLYQVAEPEIQKIAHQTGEHANLVVEDFGKAVFYAKAEGEDAFQLDTHVGKRVHLSTTSAGKAILAEFDDETIHDVLDEHGLPAVTEHTVTDRDVLFEEIEECRERGFAVDDEERIPGVRCVGAAITGDDGVLGAVSVSGPKSGMQDDRFLEDIPDLVLRTANVIEVNMKYQ